MTGENDRGIAALIGDAATRYEPAPDLRARIERRAAQQRRRRMTLALATGVLLIVAVVGVAAAQGGRDNVELEFVESPTTPTVPGNPVDWSTTLMTFTADDLRINAGDRTFLGGGPNVPVHHDPGSPDEYMTFEREWQEHGVEMRLYIYLMSDGTDWWADEIRIRDGASDAEWVTFNGDFFRAPLGQEFTGDLTLPAGATTHDGEGALTMTGVHIQAFVPPAECAAPAHPFVLELTYPDVRMAEFFSASSRLRDRNCDPVTDLSGFRFTYTPEDPGIVKAESGCKAGSPPEPRCEANANLTGLATGETTLDVTVRQASDNAIVATGTMQVTVSR